MKSDRHSGNHSLNEFGIYSPFPVLPPTAAKLLDESSFGDVTSNLTLSILQVTRVFAENTIIEIELNFPVFYHANPAGLSCDIDQRLLWWHMDYNEFATAWPVEYRVLHNHQQQYHQEWRYRFILFLWGKCHSLSDTEAAQWIYWCNSARGHRILPIPATAQFSVLNSKHGIPFNCQNPTESD